VIIDQVLPHGKSAALSWSTSSRYWYTSKIGVAFPWNRKCSTYGACECRSSTVLTDTSQWRWHSCICETRRAEKLSPPRTGNGGCPDRGSSKYLVTISSIHTTTHRAYMCFQSIFSFACDPGNNAVWMRLFAECTPLTIVYEESILGDSHLHFLLVFHSNINTLSIPNTLKLSVFVYNLITK
jgi:hypothetical protein